MRHGSHFVTGITRPLAGVASLCLTLGVCTSSLEAQGEKSTESTHSRLLGKTGSGSSTQGTKGPAPRLTIDDQSKKKQPERSASFEGLRQAGAIGKRESPDPKVAAKKAMDGLEILRNPNAVTLLEVPSDQSPKIGDEIAKGALFVRLGPDEYGHTPVGLLRGFPGFVYGKYVRDLGDGWGETAGTNVSFRVRARSGEPPLWLMPKSRTKLAIVGRTGDWYRVLSAPSVRAYVADSALEPAAKLETGAFDLDDGRTVLAGLAGEPALQKQMAAHFASLGAAWKKKAEARAEIAKREAASSKIEEAVVTIARDFDSLRGAAKTPKAIEALDALTKRVGTLKTEAATLGLESSTAVVRLDSLEGDIGRYRNIVEAVILVRDGGEVAEKDNAKETPTTEVTKPKVDPRAARRDWKRVGWIEYRPGTSDYRPFRLMKGGRTIAYLECKSGRYDLSDFTGREVGLVGDLARPDEADLKVLDIERLVILSTSK